ncbi:uncharacterized protein PRCAT00004166001 [Priceomyces carsonii]|uniref:uncharacterized protein n=1 Tax=Priceomyces carsonii TaxID=28549 RepID=UPI002ED7BD26|nr:unnamed protein product [Priceomyces carsonii]
MFANPLFKASKRFQSSVAYQQVMAKIKQDLKRSMLDKDTVKKNGIKMIMSRVKDTEIDGASQNEFVLFQTLSKMNKQRKRAVEEYEGQNREDLAAVEKLEIEIINGYLKDLPVASSEELEASLKDYLTKIKATEGNVPMGKLFKLILSELAQKWRSSPELVKPLVPKIYKQVFTK